MNKGDFLAYIKATVNICHILSAMSLSRYVVIFILDDVAIRCLKICFLLRTMIYTLLTYLCYNVLLKTEYFHRYRELLATAIFKGKWGIKTVNIFSEGGKKNSIILLNWSSCLLCYQLRVQCHNAELRANDVDVCFISVCMTGKFVER